MDPACFVSKWDDVIDQFGGVCAGDGNEQFRQVASVTLDDHDLIYSLAALGTEKVIAGCRDGALCVFGLSPTSGTDGRLHTARRRNIWSPVVDVACSRGYVAALHDATFAMDPSGEHRNILRLWDPERQVLQQGSPLTTGFVCA